MRTLLTAGSMLIAVSLAACTTTVPAPSAGDESMSSSAMHDDAMMDMLHSWMPAADWSLVTRSTNAEPIVIDDQHRMEAGMMQGEMTNVILTPEQYAQLTSPISRDALTAMASSSGWGAHLPFDADGPTGTQWGYTKTDASGQRFLVVSVHGMNCSEEPDVPVTCPQYLATVYMSDTLEAEGDL